MKASEVTVCTRAYLLAHRREPKGSGSWAFCPAIRYSRPDYLDFVFWTDRRLTYGKAKQAAREHFAALGIARVVVCS